MLTPSICAICEKVIFDQQVGLPRSPGPPQVGPASLIGLFSKIYISIPPGGPEIPANAVTPREWAIYSAWDPEPGDEERNYFFCGQIFYPNGEAYGSQVRIPINVISGQRSQALVRVAGFPIGQIGTYCVRVWLEEDAKKVGNPIDLKVELAIASQESLKPPEPL